MKTKKVLKKIIRSREKASFRRYRISFPVRGKMVGRYADYEYEYYWA